MKDKIKFLAYYLPQYHQIPENDEWWGEGFTEWTNVKRAQPLFRGHQQPILPGELGYYDLLETKDIQRRQADLAKTYGIDGLIYYQYWFDRNKMLLEKPAEKMLADKSVDMPFCFCWANETWKGIWHGLGDEKKILIEQKYGGRDFYEAYFNYLLPFFRDERYIKMENRPMLHIYRLDEIENRELFLSTFEELAKANGFAGIYFVATGNTGSPNVLNDDRINGVVGLDLFGQLRYSQEMFFSPASKWFAWERLIKTKLGMLKPLTERKKPVVLDYAKGARKLMTRIPHKKYIPGVIPNWDNSARSQNRSLVLKNSSPSGFRMFLENTVKELIRHNEIKDKMLVIKSWNEWAEGNHLEPDAKHGTQWLEQIKMVREKYNV